MTAESKLLKNIRNWLDTQTDLDYMRISDRYVKGYPDIIACVNGTMVIIELKVPILGKESLHQEEFIRRFRSVGAVGGFCRSLKEAIEYVNEARRK